MKCTPQQIGGEVCGVSLKTDLNFLELFSEITEQIITIFAFKINQFIRFGRHRR